MSILQLFTWMQQAIAYLLDPSHRVMAIGIALFVILALGRFIIKSIKLILFIGIIFILFYFGLKYLATPIR